MKYLFCLLLLLCSCGSIKNTDTAKIAVIYKNKLLKDGDHIQAVDRATIIRFSFYCTETEGVTPKIYTLGNARIDSLDPTKPYLTSSLAPNISYGYKITFTRPGSLTILFIWEGKKAIGNKITIFIDN